MDDPVFNAHAHAGNSPVESHIQRSIPRFGAYFVCHHADQRDVRMKYQAVIVNFDRKTVEYVSAVKVPQPKKVAVTTASGSTPPPASSGRGA
jgi:hypothetical protein